MKTLLLTGATDGIGFETAKMLATEGTTLLLHGRSEAKLVHAKEQLLKSICRLRNNRTHPRQRPLDPKHSPAEMRRY